MDYAIIVAGGKGLRMGTDMPKQFLSLGRLPVLMRTIECFRQYSSALQLVLVLPAEQQMYWQQLCCEHRFEVPCQLVEGGPTRFHSVKNALAAIPPSETGFVAVHDGVRPFPSLQVIRRCFDVVREAKAVVPVTEVVETLRRIEADGTSTTVPREFYRSVQTPQTFHLPLLRRAYEQLYRPSFTDDASVVESLGHRITLVEGNRENIKITTPLDLKVGEEIMKGLTR